MKPEPLPRNVPGSAPGHTILLAPSLMCADQLRLGEEIDELVRLGADWLHLDVMDGHYVPNYAFGTDQCRALGEACDLPLDMHLMVDEPDRWGPVFAQFGRAPYVTVHPDASRDPARTLEALRAAGTHPGLAVEPRLRPERFRELLGLVDLVLIMCVTPGHAGRKLLPWTIDSIRQARDLRRELGLSYRIQADGNVSWGNIPAMLEAGADVLVVGTSSLFHPAMSRADTAARLFRLIGRG